MKISEHADHTEKTVGLRAEDIHKWIDGFFDTENFLEFLNTGQNPKFDPYDHRKFRHCKEAIEQAYKEFDGKYTPDQIKAVFECHIKDDYDGYLPSRDDFANGTFTEKYHECIERSSSEKILSEVELSEYFKGKAYINYKQEKKKKFTDFHFKIVLPVIIAMLLFLGSLFVIIVPIFHENMMDSKKEMERELTRTATSIIHRYIEQEQQGLLTREQAQQKAIAEMNELRYGKEMKDYFWITDMQPKMIMHPYRQDLIGKDLSNYTDSKDRSGKKLFVEFVNLIEKNNEGFLEYLWQWKDDSTQLVPKLSYVKAIPEWDWIVGTGIYIDDVEEEIGKLEQNLMLAFLIIAMTIFVIILYVVAQSHRIENDRKKAETGLLEAKERYRALVEASNEGYILAVDGVNIYSNHTLQRLLGYDELELAAEGIWDTILPEIPVNKQARENIEKILTGQASSMECEARMRTKSGVLIDVIISTSKIFFSNKNGNVIAVRSIRSSKIVFEKNGFKPAQDSGQLPMGIILEIENSSTVGHIVHTLNHLPAMMREMLANKVDSQIIRGAICRIFDSVMLKAIEISQVEAGPSPAKFAFITLGSNARREMTMFSDQDNALIFENVEKDKLEDCRRYFLHFADRVCRTLDKAGYPFCPGGIMAVNPGWCLSVDEWKKRFTTKTFNADPEAIQEVNTIFDISYTYGNKDFVSDIQSHMIGIVDENPEFFMHFARNCLTYQVPLTAMGNIRPAKQGNVKTINLKECIIPIVNFARIYALKNGITAPATLARLNKLAQMGIIQSETLSDITNAFNHLWHLRFYNQIICHADLQRVNDNLELKKLSEAETKKLRSTLAKISLIQTKLSYDFLGMPHDI